MTDDQIRIIPKHTNPAPDYTLTMMKAAAETGVITVYSSRPIVPGAFITPSRMEAESYGGGERIYEKTVGTEEVAWIDAMEGMYTGK